MATPPAPDSGPWPAPAPDSGSWPASAPDSGSWATSQHDPSAAASAAPPTCFVCVLARGADRTPLRTVCERHFHTLHGFVESLTRGD